MSDRTGNLIVPTVFLSLFVCAGMAVAVFGTQQVLADRVSETWLEVPAVVEQAEIEDAPDLPWQWRIAVRFRYHAGGSGIEAGTARTSTRLALDDRTGDDYAALLRQVHRWQDQPQTTCRVDPADPDSAVLLPGTEASALVPLLFGSAFAGIPLLIIVLMWMLPRRGSEGTARRRKLEGRAGAAGLLIFFGFFALIGGVVMHFMVIQPWLDGRRAASWVEVPCRVEKAEVLSHTDSDDGTTYSIAVLYRYRHQGRDFASSRQSFATGSSSSRDWRDAMVDDLRQRPDRTCFIDPADPYQAVLDRSPSPDLVFGFIPGIFVLVGLGGMIGVAIHLARAGRPRPAASGVPTVPTTPAAPAGPRLLKPKSSPLGKVFGALFFCVLWNGIISVFVVLWFTQEDMGLLMGLFLLPFVGVGLLLLGYVPYSILALANPRPVLHLDPAEPVLGGRAKVTWEFPGGIGNITRLAIRLLVSRQESHGSGKNRHTHSTGLVDEMVFESIEPVDLRAGSASFDLPLAPGPSDHEGDSQLHWKLHLRGEIAFWPDVSEDYPLQVRPPALSEAASAEGSAAGDADAPG